MSGRWGGAALTGVTLPGLPGPCSGVDGGQSCQIGEAGHGQVVTFCHQMCIRDRMQVAEYSVVYEDGKVTGRHHHHVILQGNLTWQEIKDLWRDSTGRPMGLVKVEPIDLTCSSFERLTTYMTKARARIRRWRTVSYTHLSGSSRRQRSDVGQAPNAQRQEK